MKSIAIILAGGKGERMNRGMNKVLIPVCGQSPILRSARAFSGLVDETVIVTRSGEEDIIRKDVYSVDPDQRFHYVCGGLTRQESVLNGLLSIHTEPDDIILIHDAARCLVDSGLISRVLQSVTEFGTGIPGIPVTSTYKICDREGYVRETPDRTELYEIQTPQGFRADTIIPVSVRAAQEKISGTDDASLLEYYHIPVRIVEGSVSNLKLTTPDDLSRAESILKGADHPMRIGMGYDVHQLTDNRKLILCGVEINHDKGLLGHSDADVALHALMDAMLGACAFGDIGHYFPDSDPRYSGISSVILLQHVNRIIRNAGYKLYNADITIVAQQPKIAPYIPQMQKNVAAALEVPLEMINVKATTTEKLGFEGRKEGISAYAVCTVSPDQPSFESKTE